MVDVYTQMQILLQLCQLNKERKQMKKLLLATLLAASFISSSADAVVIEGSTGAGGFITIAASPAGSLGVEQKFTYNHIVAATTTTVKTGAGVLHSISINSKGTIASITTIFDSTTGSGAVIGIVDSLKLFGSMTMDVQFTNGLTIVTTGTVAPDITVSYR